MECLHIAVAVEAAEEEGGGQGVWLTEAVLHRAQGGGHRVYLGLEAGQELLLLARLLPGEVPHPL